MGGRERQGRTQRFISTGYVSAALHLCHASRADLVVGAELVSLFTLC